MSSGPWDGLTAAELRAVARELRRLADEIARTARERRQAERQASDDARREIWADIRENGFEANR